jgi:hypothetical protein
MECHHPARTLPPTQGWPTLSTSLLSMFFHHSSCTWRAAPH